MCRKQRQQFSSSDIVRQKFSKGRSPDLGLVVPLADAYYRSDDPANVYRDKDIMAQTARKLKPNFRELSKQSILPPSKFHLLRLCPQFLLKIGLTMVFRSHFGDVFMYRHAMKSPEEMRQLHRDFYSFIGERR